MYSLPRKYLKIPLQVITDYSQVESSYVITILDHSFIVANNSLAYVYISNDYGESEDPEFLGPLLHYSTFKTGVGFPRTSFFRVNLGSSSIFESCDYSPLCTDIMVAKKYPVPLNNGSLVTCTNTFQGRGLLVLPRIFSRSREHTLRVGDLVICPVLDLNLSKKYRGQRPIIAQNEEGTSAEIYMYSEPIKIRAICKKQNLARVITPEGERYFHTGLLLRPLEFIPYL